MLHAIDRSFEIHGLDDFNSSINAVRALQDLATIRDDFAEDTAIRWREIVNSGFILNEVLVADIDVRKVISNAQGVEGFDIFGFAHVSVEQYEGAQELIEHGGSFEPNSFFPYRIGVSEYYGKIAPSVRAKMLIPEASVGANEDYHALTDAIGGGNHDFSIKSLFNNLHRFALDTQNSATVRSV